MLCLLLQTQTQTTHVQLLNQKNLDMYWLDSNYQDIKESHTSV